MSSILWVAFAALVTLIVSFAGVTAIEHVGVKSADIIVALVFFAGYVFGLIRSKLRL